MVCTYYLNFLGADVVRFVANPHLHLSTRTSSDLTGWQVGWHSFTRSDPSEATPIWECQSYTASQVFCPLLGLLDARSESPEAKPPKKLWHPLFYYFQKMSVVVLGDQLSVSDLNCGRAGGNIDYLGDDAWVCRWVICPWVVCNWEFADNLTSCAGCFYSSLILLF